MQGIMYDSEDEQSIGDSIHTGKVTESIHTVTFNTNGQNFTDEAILSGLLAGAEAATIVVLALQECSILPERMMPAASVSQSANNVLRRAASDDGAADRALLSALSTTLNKGSTKDPLLLVADVAMGEPVHEARNSENQWYGCIRLLVYIRSELITGTPVTTLLVPCGTKESSFEKLPPYLAERSPDKGGVCVHLPGLQLAIVNGHLAATNKYGVGEREFEAQRLRQLDRVHAEMKSHGMLAKGTRLLVLGDLNYRVETSSAHEDKLRGGKEFQAVSRVLQGGKAAMRDLFLRHDRLNAIMRGAATPVPALLGGLRDLQSELAKGPTGVFPPTFSLATQTDDKAERRYSDKRTPSWTDRVLWTSNAGLDMLDGGAVPEVRISDHVPVFARLQLRLTQGVAAF